MGSKIELAIHLSKD